MKFTPYSLAGLAMLGLVSLSQGQTVRAVPGQRQITQIRAVPTLHRFAPIKFIVTNLPDKDLRPAIKQNQLQVKNQGNRNTCSVFAITFCLEFLFATQKGFGIATDFSEEYLNTMKNVACNIKKDGGFFSQIDRGYKMYGIYMSGLVPYKPAYDPNYSVPQAYVDVAKKWDRAQSDFIKEWDPSKGASAAQIAKACQYLDQNVAVAGGFLWPNNLQFETKAGLQVMRVPTMKSQVFDGHSVALVGYKKSNVFPGGGYFIIRNSWGSGWGEDGYAYMPFDYVAKYANDLYALHF